MNDLTITVTQIFYLVFDYLRIIYGTSQPCYSCVPLMLSLIGQLKPITCWGYQTKVLQYCTSHVASSFLKFNYHSQYTATNTNLIYYATKLNTLS